MQTTRCPRCGLTQMTRDACKACGAALAAGAAPSQPRHYPRAESRLQPYLDIWTRPRDTIRGIVNSDPSRAVILLAWLGGIAETLGNGLFRATSNDVSVWILLVVALYMGPLFGFASTYVGGGLVRMTGGWLGGRANSEECRAALAWAGVPQVAALVLWIPALALFGNELTRKDTPLLDSSPALLAAVAVFGLLWAVTFAWSAVVRWKCLGEVHGFSAWRGLFASAIAWTLVIAVMVGLVLGAVALDVFPSKKANPSGDEEEQSAAAGVGGQRVDPAVRIPGLDGRRGMGADRPSPVRAALVPPHEALADLGRHVEDGGLAVTGQPGAPGADHEARQLAVEISTRA
jgi:hypothetical protein